MQPPDMLPALQIHQERVLWLFGLPQIPYLD